MVGMAHAIEGERRAAFPIPGAGGRGGEDPARRRRRLMMGVIVPLRAVFVCGLDICPSGEEAALDCLWSTLAVPKLGLSQGGYF